MKRRKVVLLLVLGITAGLVAYYAILGEAPRRAGAGKEAMPLKQAVDSFNQEAVANKIGRDQPPLKIEEVIAAIRGWSRTKKPVSDEISGNCGQQSAAAQRFTLL